MTTLASASDSNTPLSQEELADLIPNLATKEELNEWERENILRAREWAVGDRTAAPDLASDDYVRKLHTKMFDQTWKWAGEYRRSEKNIGIPFHEIRERLMALFGDFRYWIERNTYPLDEIAVRFHHRLVLVHPFPNGNGRHARLIADVIAMRLGRPAFTWGSANLVREGEARTGYLEAIRAADNGDIQPLLKFARS
jgi:Fic-DOC domain mobile mystery protein B